MTTSKTVRIRAIAIVSDDSAYVVCGSSGMSDRELRDWAEELSETVCRTPDQASWIEADIPLQDEPTIKGEVSDV